MKPLASLCLIAVVFCAACSGPTKASAPVTRPNIIVIVTDDQAPHTLSTYGNTVCQTPSLDRLAKNGMTLDNAYHMGAWSGAVCLPSRVMIMSGRTLWHIPGGMHYGKHPHMDNTEMVPPNVLENTMPAVFNRAGYDTFRTCKDQNSYMAANALFMTRRDKTMRGRTEEDAIKAESIGSSDWHGDQAIEFLDAHAGRGGDVPFLMYYGFSHPHDIRNGPAGLLDKYGAYNAKTSPTEVNPKAPPVPVSWLPEHPFPNPYGHKRIRDEVHVSGVKASRTEATVRNELGREYACIENLDIQIGRVMDKLEAMGELDNTYVIFTADHGIAVGRHGLMGKQNLYEHSWRVPMLVMGPGVEPGSRADGNVYLLDLLATICEFAGVDAPKTNEGKSFAPVAWGKQDTVRDMLYGVYSGGEKPGMRSIRKGDWKMIKIDTFDGALRKTQLFNLKDNPEELVIEHHAPAVIAKTGNTPKPNQRDLADDPKYAAVRAELEADLYRLMKQHDDPYRLWDQPE